MSDRSLDELGHRAAIALREQAARRPRPAFVPRGARERLQAAGLPGVVSVAAAVVALAVVVTGVPDGRAPSIDPVPDAPSVGDPSPPGVGERHPEAPAVPACDEQLDRRVGGDRWELAPAFGRFDALVVDGLAFLGTGAGDQTFGTACLFALDPQTGETVWHFERRQRGAFWPVAVDDVVVASSFSAPTVGLDRATGEERWRSEPALETVVDDRGNLLLRSPFRGTGHALVNVDPASGRERWRYEFEGGVHGMALDAGRVAVSAREQAHVLDLDTGQLLHGPFALGASRSVASLHGHQLVAGRPATNLSVFDVRTGELVWERRVPGSRLGEHLITDDGLLVVPSDDAQVHAIELDDATVRWRAPLASWPSLRTTTNDLADGGRSIYVGTQEGITVVDVVAGAVRWEYEGLRARVALVLAGGQVFSQHGQDLLRLDMADGQLNEVAVLPATVHQLETSPTHWLARAPGMLLGIER